MKRKNPTTWQLWWGGGVGTHDTPKSHISEDSWNAALYAAVDRLKMYGITDAHEILEILFTD